MNRAPLKPAITGVLLASIYLVDFLALLAVSMQVPFCPEELIMHSGNTIFCRSYLWGALGTGLIQLLTFSAVLELCFRHRVAIKWQLITATMPLLYLVFFESALKKEAMDIVAPMDADKVELNWRWEPTIAYIMIALFLSLIIIGHLFRMHKRLRLNE